MIVTRAPLRISLGGGGTDLPAYYEQHGGFVLAAAIDKYVHIALNRPPLLTGYHLRYSRSESAMIPEDIEHPIFRECLAKTAPPVEIAVLSDVPAGTGLGSSGAFTVALLKALSPDKPRRWLAEEAGTVEIVRLARNTGEQDNYTAAYGGVRAYTFHASGKVQIEDLDPGPLASRLCLFFTGFSRDAAEVLAPQAANTDNLHATKRLGYEAATLIAQGHLDDYGHLLHEHWMLKRKRSDGITSPRIDALYEMGLEAGALGGKLVGAGGGGFLLFYARDPERLRHAMPLVPLEFGFDYEGAR